MREKRLNLRLSEEDYEKIKRNSKDIGMTMNAFITASATKPVIIQYNYDAINDCIEAFYRMRVELFWILTDNKLIYPDDINAVLDCIKNINDTLNKMMKQTRRERTALDKALRSGKYDHLLLRKNTENV